MKTKKILALCLLLVSALTLLTGCFELEEVHSVKGDGSIVRTVRGYVSPSTDSVVSDSLTPYVEEGTVTKDLVKRHGENVIRYTVIEKIEAGTKGSSFILRDVRVSVSGLKVVLEATLSHNEQASEIISYMSEGTITVKMPGPILSAEGLRKKGLSNEATITVSAEDLNEGKSVRIEALRFNIVGIMMGVGGTLTLLFTLAGVILYAYCRAEKKKLLWATPVQPTPNEVVTNDKND